MTFDQITIFDNIVIEENTVTYCYKIEPVNTIYSSNQQSSEICKTFESILLKVNRPGQLVVRPKRYDVDKIIDYYEEQFLKYGNKDLTFLKERIVNETRDALNKKPRYRYDIYLFFVQERESIDKKFKKGFFSEFFGNIFNLKIDKILVLDEAQKEVLETASQQIYNDIVSHSSDLVHKLTDKEEITRELNYLVCPVQRDVYDFNIIPLADHLNYKVKYDANSSLDSDFYTRHLILNKFPEQLNSPTKFFNNWQMNVYPTDIIVKFEPKPSKDVEKKLAKAQFDIERDVQNQMRVSRIKRKSVEQRKAEIVASGATETAILEHEVQLAWQMQVRIVAESYETLCKRTDDLKGSLKRAGIGWSYALQHQHELLFDTLPWRSTYKDHLMITDIGFFTMLNLLGGIKIGFEKGFWIGSTVPGDLPVFSDINAILEGRAKANEPLIAVTGATGGGKTQIVNNITLLSAVFLGHRIFYIQPKPEASSKLLPLFYDSKTNKRHFTNLVLGGTGQQGMFDPYLTNRVETNGIVNMEAFREATEEAKIISSALIRTENPNVEFNSFAIEHAANKMLEQYNLARTKNKPIKMTMLGILANLKDIDMLAFQSLFTVAKNNVGALFFSETGEEIGFDLSQPFNMVTFKSLPSTSRNQRSMNSKQHQLHRIVLSRLEVLLNRFNEIYQGKPKTIVQDEYRIFSAYEEGKDLIDGQSRVIRQAGALMYLISQNLSDYDSGIFNATGQLFIGNIKTESEVELAIQHLDLENSETIKNRLRDTTTKEGVKESDKYVFMFKDPNNRKCFIKMNILPVFQEAFKTLMEVEENEQSI